MKNRNGLIILILLFFCIFEAISQEKFIREDPPVSSIQQGRIQPISGDDEQFLSSIKKLPLPDSYPGGELPYKHDNWGSPYLRPAFLQDGASCAQAASIGYNFTYEINRLRDLPADVPENQYPTHFAWNFMNWENDTWVGTGSSYFHTYELLKKAGTPSVEVYGGMSLRGDSAKWMSGYEKYYHAMQNRIGEVYAIDVSTEEGIIALKHWIHNHMEGSPAGGVANYYAGLTGYTYLPEGTPEEYKPIIIQWYSEATHAMTIIGYNDSIRYDINNDGRYTNHIDITGDGIVDVRDWEIGGVKFINSYNINWGHLGTCYMLYRSLAEYYGMGGIWDNVVHVLDAKGDYTPEVTAKIILSHTSRNKLKISAGISCDTAKAFPDHTLDFPIIDYQGGDIFIGGGNEEEDKTLEFGLDITPLLSHYNGGTATFFFQVTENDPENKGTGSIDHFSVIDYTNGIHETISQDAPVSLNENDITIVSVNATISSFEDNVMISDTTIPVADPQQYYEHQFTAEGGTPPYTWELMMNYTKMQCTNPVPTVEAEELNPDLNHYGTVTKELDFSFPFYNNFYDSVTIHTSGAILFEKNDYPWPYLKDLSLQLRACKTIVPFFSKDFMLYHFSNDGIWYEGDENYALFRWKVSDQNHATGSSYEFIAKLFSTGEIEFYFDNMLFRDPVQWISGVSNGDHANYTINESLHTSTIEELVPVRLIPTGIPGSIRINDNGLLHGYTDEKMIHEIQVKVRDNKNISNTKKFELTQGLKINYEITSGEDTYIERNEKVIFDLFLENRGSIPYENPTLMLRIDDPYVELIDSTITLENITPGETISLKNVFSFMTFENISDKHSIFCRIQFNSQTGEFCKKIFLEAFSPVLSAGSINIADGNDGILQPGETAKLSIKINNQGHAEGYSVQGELVSADPYLSFHESTHLEFGDIPARDFSIRELSVAANTSTPKGHIASFTLNITDSAGFMQTEQLSIQISSNPVIVVDLDENLNSAHMIFEAIGENMIGADYSVYIPWWDLHKYDAVFVCLGVFPLHYHLDDSEGEILADYLNEGGNIYLEGGATWFSAPQTVVHPMFGIEATNASWTTGIDTLCGQPSTFTEDLSFVFDGDNLRIDNIEPVFPAISLFRNKTDGLGFIVAHETDTYKTIGSSAEFGGFHDSLPPNTKKELVRRYLKFFDMDTDALAANFTASKHAILPGDQVIFENLSTVNVVEWNWEFPGGSPGYSTEENPSVTYNEKGIFDVGLTVSNGTETNTLVKNDYIKVVDETGINNALSDIHYKIYPNPSSGISNLLIETQTHQLILLRLINNLGVSVREKTISVNGKHLEKISLKDLEQGIYYLQLLSGKNKTTCKILCIK